MNDYFPILAIDGGAASGKSSTSKAVAEKLGFMHVDTGSHYRTLTLALLRKGIGLDNIDLIPAKLSEIHLTSVVKGQEARLAINGFVPADKELRTQEVNEVVSQFAAFPEVRQALFQYQRDQAEIARKEGFEGLVMEGRDIGSVIFPETPLRFFFHADPEIRAKRREKQGHQDQIQQRDAIDSTRKAAPLTCPKGATQVDTANHTLGEVIQIILDAIRAFRNKVQP
jgi:cytidylate kinase